MIFCFRFFLFLHFYPTEEHRLHRAPVVIAAHPATTRKRAILVRRVRLVEQCHALPGAPYTIYKCKWLSMSNHQLFSVSQSSRKIPTVSIPVGYGGAMALK